MMASRFLLLLFSLVPTLIVGQKYVGAGSIASFYPYELTDDENGDMGGGLVSQYANKHDDGDDDDDDNTSNEVKPWRRRFNMLNTDLQILKNIKRSQKRQHRLADSAEVTSKRHHYDPMTEGDEDEFDSAPLQDGFQPNYLQSIRRHRQQTRSRQYPLSDYHLMTSLLRDQRVKRMQQIWDPSCKCWKFDEPLHLDRRRYSINMPLSVISWVVEKARREDDIAKSRMRLKELGRK